MNESKVNLGTMLPMTTAVRERDDCYVLSDADAIRRAVNAHDTLIETVAVVARQRNLLLKALDDLLISLDPNSFTADAVAALLAVKEAVNVHGVNRRNVKGWQV